MILSIHRFCSENQMCVTFDSQRVRVLDPTTKEVVLEGQKSDGLYLDKELAAELNKESP